jgi:hypothetical protein
VGKRIFQLVGLVSFGVIICWGTVLTFSRVKEYREGGDDIECRPDSVCYTGFITTAVLLLAFTIFFVVCAVCVVPAALLGLCFLFSKRGREEFDDAEIAGSAARDK